MKITNHGRTKWRKTKEDGKFTHTIGLVESA
jgi:hypothetical protein